MILFVILLDTTTIIVLLLKIIAHLLVILNTHVFGKEFVNIDMLLFIGKEDGGTTGILEVVLAAAIE